MKKEDFALLMKYNHELVNRCNQVCSGTWHQNVTKKKLNYFEAIKINCLEARKLESELDKAKTDLYHVVGMGQMNAVQISQYVKSVKEALRYRCTVRLLSSSLLINENKKEKPESVYQTQCGIELKAKKMVDLD